MKRFLTIFSFIAFFLSFKNPVFALNCQGGIGGTIIDQETGQGISDATILVNSDSLHPVMSRDDGGFTYGWPVNATSVPLSIARNGHSTINVSLSITDCVNNTITLSSTSGSSSSGTSGHIVGACLDKQVDTALGCVPTDASAFVTWFLGWAAGIGGGIALLFIIYGGFLVITSKGDPQKVQAGKSMLTSAISGLLFIIFSLFILKLIGVKILDIPDFFTSPVNVVTPVTP